MTDVAGTTPLATTDQHMISEPGLYPDISNEDYHNDPIIGGSLSSTGARRLIAPSCPALYKYQLDNPPPHKDHFDLGSTAHKLVLGAGDDIEIAQILDKKTGELVDAENWQTKAAREAKTAARSAGRIPMLRKNYTLAEDMAEALARHPVASALFSQGKAEQTIVWQDEATGVMCRAKLDWMRDDRRWVSDYKTSADLNPDKLGRKAGDFGYPQQADFYLTGLRILGLIDPGAPFLFVFQSTDPPHLITIANLDEVAMQAAAIKNRKALETFAECRSSGQWPDFTNGEIAELSLPAWETREVLG